MNFRECDAYERKLTNSAFPLSPTPSEESPDLQHISENRKISYGLAMLVCRHGNDLYTSTSTDASYCNKRQQINSNSVCDLHNLKHAAENIILLESAPLSHSTLTQR